MQSRVKLTRMRSYEFASLKVRLARGRKHNVVGDKGRRSTGGGILRADD